MFKEIVRKSFTGILILLLSIRLVVPAFVWADTPIDTPTPTPTDAPTPTVDQTTVNNGASNTNTTNSTANTGNNTTTVDTGTPTPTDTPTDTPTPTPDPNATLPTNTSTPTPDITIDPSATDSSTVTASNDATVNNTANTTSNTGSNTVSSDGSGPTPTITSESTTPTPTPTPQITVQTGDAVSVVAGDNTINTTSVNSDLSTQTINIFGDQTGNIDLSTLFQLVANIVTNDKTTDPVINVQVTGVNNYAYLANNVISTANTGGNSSTGTGDVVVNTGNAESVVSLINKVNLTVVNSSFHLVTINIFGQLTGNIILPNLTPLQSTSCTSCGVSFNTNNQVVVNNNVGSTANTGSNTVTASGDATLTTGDAQSNVNITNVVNTNLLGVIFENLFINEFGNWNGSFLGWDSFGPQGSGTLALSSQGALGGTNPSSTIQNTAINNTAYVNNNINSLANTGNNYTNGNNVNVHTGSAYSAVSLLNFINSNFINSLGFFGFINIFGNWNGDIGGANEFVTPTPTPEVQQAATDNTPPIEDGGALSITNSNNVGAYVLPGDTITFFLHPKNIGTGKVYGAKVQLYLVKDGQAVGGTTFNLGDIDAGKGFKITTGLVLSKNTPGGAYIARAVVSGTTGPQSSPVSATADSTFTVFGTTLGTNTNEPTPTVIPLLHKAILGATTNHNSRSDEPLYMALLGVLLGYVLVRILKAREQLIMLFTEKADLKSKLHMLRLFLL